MKNARRFFEVVLNFILAALDGLLLTLAFFFILVVFGGKLIEICNLTPSRRDLRSLETVIHLICIWAVPLLSFIIWRNLQLKAKCILSLLLVILAFVVGPNLEMAAVQDQDLVLEYVTQYWRFKTTE